ICIAITVLFSDPYNINLNGLIDNLTPNLLLALFIRVVLQFAGHYHRAVKHSLLLNRVRPVKTYEIFKGQSIGYLFNFILPFRIGELIRAHYIARGVSISRSAVFATIIFERFIDLAVLLTLVIPLVILAFEGKGS